MDCRPEGASHKEHKSKEEVSDNDNNNNNSSLCLLFCWLTHQCIYLSSHKIKLCYYVLQLLKLSNVSKYFVTLWNMRFCWFLRWIFTHKNWPRLSVDRRVAKSERKTDFPLDCTPEPVPSVMLYNHHFLYGFLSIKKSEINLLVEFWIIWCNDYGLLGTEKSTWLCREICTDSWVLIEMDGLPWRQKVRPNWLSPACHKCHQPVWGAPG